MTVISRDVNTHLQNFPYWTGARLKIYIHIYIFIIYLHLSQEATVSQSVTNSYSLPFSLQLLQREVA